MGLGWFLRDIFLAIALLAMTAFALFGVVMGITDIQWLRENQFLGLTVGEWAFYIVGGLC